MDDKDLVGRERKCPVCGKVFILVDDDWAYKRGGKPLCSWSCLRAYESGQKRNKLQKREQVIQAIKDGLSNKEIMLLVGAQAKTVWYWRDKLKREEQSDA